MIEWGYKIWVKKIDIAIKTAENILRKLTEIGIPPPPPRTTVKHAGPTHHSIIIQLQTHKEFNGLIQILHILFLTYCFSGDMIIHIDVLECPLYVN